MPGIHAGGPAAQSAIEIQVDIGVDTHPTPGTLHDMQYKSGDDDRWMKGSSRLVRDNLNDIVSSCNIWRRRGNHPCEPFVKRFPEEFLPLPSVAEQPTDTPLGWSRPHSRPRARHPPAAPGSLDRQTLRSAAHPLLCGNLHRETTSAT